MLKTVRSTALLAAIALTLAVAPLSAADRMVPGMWQFTSSAANGETHTFKHCVTPDEAGSVNGDARSARANAQKRAAGTCTITDYNINGNVVSYAMVCGKTSVRSTATYRGDAFEADLMTKPEGAAEVASHVSARRVGVCGLTVVK
jgi:hypothetical protein